MKARCAEGVAADRPGHSEGECPPTRHSAAGEQEPIPPPLSPLHLLPLPLPLFPPVAVAVVVAVAVAVRNEMNDCLVGGSIIRDKDIL